MWSEGKYLLGPPLRNTVTAKVFTPLQLACYHPACDEKRLEKRVA